MEDWARVIRKAAGRPEVSAAVGRLYDEVQREIERRRPICHASGRCCRFGEYGHRLYVTTIELAAFVCALEGAASLGDTTGQVCPFQEGGLCSVHPIRPFGCRIFFCDATAGVWQTEQYERFHARLQALHDELKVPYRYGQWLDALEVLGLDRRPTGHSQTLSLPQVPL